MLAAVPFGDGRSQLLLRFDPVVSASVCYLVLFASHFFFFCSSENGYGALSEGPLFATQERVSFRAAFLRASSL